MVLWLVVQLAVVLLDFGVKAFAYGNPSILALPIYGETIIGVIIAIIAAFVVSSVVSYFSGFEDVPVKIKTSNKIVISKFRS